ncbi:MAG: hypothetical protein M1828_003306 [Chrysothrix sp. TS-e1954]|nr:MAG: hypothetical protein M1828_003306 [Chrysothrix sp. TS-e1954]
MDAPPESILVIGSGVFGLSTLHELLQRPKYKKTAFTLLSQSLPAFNESSDAVSPTWQGTSDLISSHDTTRIVRADYADPVYSDLAHEAQRLWRGEWGVKGRYTESGLLLTATNGSDGDTYVRSVLKNLRGDSESNPGLEELPDPEAIEKGLRAPGSAVGTGDRGYINNQSGRADATAAMEWLYGEVKALAGDRVRLVRQTASRLVCNEENTRVEGAMLEDGAKVTAALTILASGAWTPALIDLRGRASARGQCVAYIDITEEEAKKLRDMPVHINLTSGCFIFPPTAIKGGWELKVARHAYGYSNPMSIQAPLGVGSDEKEIKVSLPSFEKGLPRPDARILKEFVETTLPLIAPLDKKQRKMRPRKCWYLDTASGDYLVCRHPEFESSLFLATGGSGHAFKFCPALGKHIVDILEGRDAASKYSAKWAWPEKGKDDEVWCEDHSRAGEPGLVLEEAFKIP